MAKMKDPEDKMIRWTNNFVVSAKTVLFLFSQGPKSYDGGKTGFSILLLKKSYRERSSIPKTFLDFRSI
jgi:hypothetical protein